MDLETYLHKQALLKDLNRNLQRLEARLVLVGGEMYANNELMNSIEATKQNIVAVKRDIAEIALSLIKTDDTIKEEFERIISHVFEKENEVFKLRELIRFYRGERDLLRQVIEISRDLDLMKDHLKTNQAFAFYRNNIQTHERDLDIRDKNDES